MTSELASGEAASFDTAVLEALAGEREITIETRSRDRWHPTTIWVVVVEGVVFVRSVRGDRGSWYRRALADPGVRLVFDDESVTAVAVPAPDAASVERANSGFKAKYRKGRSLDAMLLGEVLHTTLRLDPGV